mgnify:CR=1 FL=1
MHQHQIHTDVTFTSSLGECVTIHSVEQFPDWAAQEDSTSSEVRLHTVVCHVLQRVLHHAALHHAVLHHAVLHHAVLHMCTASCCTRLLAVQDLLQL